MPIVIFAYVTSTDTAVCSRDIALESIDRLPDVFTQYLRSNEPLRERPRVALPAPAEGALPLYPAPSVIPNQPQPFSIPADPVSLVDALVNPVKNFMSNPPGFPYSAVSAHPFRGGETAAQGRLRHLAQSESMKDYKKTRNGLIGTEFSTKLSAYLAQGCVTSRQIHQALVEYEDGTDSALKTVEGFGAGENEGTAAVRFELLWRDYMRLCHRKFKKKLFMLEGFQGADAGYDGNGGKQPRWKFPVPERAGPSQNPSAEHVAQILERFNAGTTGMGLIDASQRELLHTGYTSNRARQNVASFLAKHLGIDWRYGAEWYEMLLVDYDVSSNWANWQYVAGVGNDPRSDVRIFNPVKQTFDYDKNGDYIRTWVQEVRRLQKPENVYQAWTASEADLENAGLVGNPMAVDPIKRIDFSMDGKFANNNKRPNNYRKKNRGYHHGSGRGRRDQKADSSLHATRDAPPVIVVSGQVEDGQALLGVGQPGPLLPTQAAVSRGGGGTNSRGSGGRQRRGNGGRGGYRGFGAGRGVSSGPHQAIG